MEVPKTHQSYFFFFVGESEKTGFAPAKNQIVIAPDTLSQATFLRYMYIYISFPWYLSRYCCDQCPPHSFCARGSNLRTFNVSTKSVDEWWDGVLIPAYSSIFRCVRIYIYIIYVCIYYIYIYIYENLYLCINSVEDWPPFGTVRSLIAIKAHWCGKRDPPQKRLQRVW